ncbi:unnamed protein product, partial [Lymnaea stagnalis]
ISIARNIVLRAPQLSTESCQEILSNQSDRFLHRFLRASPCRTLLIRDLEQGTQRRLQSGERLHTPDIYDSALVLCRRSGLTLKQLTMNTKPRRPKATTVYSDDRDDAKPSVSTRDFGTYYDANSRATPEGEVPDRRQELRRKRTEFDLPADRYSDHGYDDDDDDDARTVTLGKGQKSSSIRSDDDGGDDDDDELDEDGEVESNNIEDDIKYKEMLDQSTVELRETIEGLEKSLDTIENENNEWKTRFETQTEMNQQLEKQILMLQEKVEDAKRNLKEVVNILFCLRILSLICLLSPFQASPQMVKALEKEKNSLYNQLRDLEWRLDQESKAYHKANDERKQYVLEINATKGTIGDLRTKQRHLMLTAQEAPPRITPRVTGDTPRTYRDGGG